MPTRRAPRRLHPALAISMALGLHAALLFGVRFQAARGTAPHEDQEAIEFSMLTEAPPVETAPEALPLPAEARQPAASRGVRRATARESSAALSPESGTNDGAPSVSNDTGAADESADGSAPAKHIDLGLNDGVRRAALAEGWIEPVAKPKPPSDGGLSAGLAALDAERGQSRSSAANHAAYEAARRFAPPQGMGIFDILTDDHGVVLSVHLANAPADEARWQRVAEELRTLLKDRRMRVPPGAKGLAARLRIETGDLAKNIADRFRQPRGAALGQGFSHPSEQRNESTRASLEPGQLSPTLGVTVAGGGGGNDPNIRIVLLSEQAL
jgi:hypothetical protein